MANGAELYSVFSVNGKPKSVFYHSGNFIVDNIVFSRLDGQDCF